jgi:ubiquinone/menaquinone biosynthesis C-methylase UbiE
MTTDSEGFQLSTQAAEIYESMFVPALFAEWAEWVVDAGDPQPGQSVLDVACGTGIVARLAAERMGGKGSVAGVDLNPAMLAVARRLAPEIEWRQADAADLPIAPATFDVVLCQAALMFFPDRQAALGEMARVLRPGGRLIVQVWSSLEAQPGYGPFIQAASRHAGPAAGELLDSYWVMGDVDQLRRLFTDAGLAVEAIDTRTGTVRYDSVDQFVRAELEGTPLVERIGEEAYRRIRLDAHEALAEFVTTDGRARVPIEGHIFTARSATA